MAETIDPAICIPNIGPRERRKRLIGGLAALAVAVVVGVILFAAGQSRWWRLALLPLFYGGTAGIFQWREKT